MIKHYTTAVTLPCSSERAFIAISKELKVWWGKQDKLINKPQITFRVSWGELWFQFKVVDYDPPQQMIWKCTDANQKIPGLTHVEKEWVGTKIHWKLQSNSSQKSTLLFTHEGLNTKLQCCDFCSKSWKHFLQNSLVQYLSS